MIVRLLLLTLAFAAIAFLEHLNRRLGPARAMFAIRLQYPIWVLVALDWQVPLVVYSLCMCWVGLRMASEIRSRIEWAGEELFWQERNRQVARAIAERKAAVESLAKHGCPARYSCKDMTGARGYCINHPTCLGIGRT